MMDDIDTWKRYITIGSYETRVAAEFLIKPLWNLNMTMDDFAELAYFIIKYVDRFKTDITVGLEGQEPLVWLIPNISTIGRASDQYTETLESKVKQMLDNFSMEGVKLLMAHTS